MFLFQHSQITQNDFDKLAKLLSKYPTVYTTSKFDVGKISSPLHLPLKPDAIFKKQRPSKVPIHLHDKVYWYFDESKCKWPIIDESKCNWPIKPIQVILTKLNGKFFTTADMNSAYNQMPLDEQSRQLTKFVIGNQQYEFSRLFHGISIGPAAFSAFMSKIFRPLKLKQNAITYLDDVLMQSQTKDEMFIILEQYSNTQK